MRNPESEAICRVPREDARIQIELRTDRCNGETLGERRISADLSRIRRCRARTPGDAVIAEDSQRRPVDERRKDSQAPMGYRERCAVLGAAGERLRSIGAGGQEAANRKGLP